MAPGVGTEQIAYYVQLLDKVRALPEWKDFMGQGAYKQTAMSGPEFVDWLERAQNFHRVLMREAKLAVPAASTVVSTVAPPNGKK